MELTTETLPNDVTLVRLVGRMDVNGAASIDLKFNALAGAHRALIVDLAGVSFVASMGIRSLLIAARTVASKKGKMALLAPSGDVATVLKTARIEHIVPICATKDEAIAKVTSA